jgi:hypothetical protein
MHESSIYVRSISGRRFLLVLFVCVAFNLMSGCRWLGFHTKDQFVTPPPCVFAPDATKDEIIGHVNAQASQLHAWRSSRVAIQLKQPGMLPFDLSADMAVESPINFRLRVKSFAGAEADFGSNPERFWFWIKRADYPQVMTAAHEHLAMAQREFPIPFEPEWVMEAFGVRTIDPSQYEMENVKENRVNLISHQTSSSGQRVMKVIGVDVCTGHVVEHSLYDETSRLIARATMSKHTPTSNGLEIPYRLTLEWPQTGITMKLTLLDAEINPTYTPETVWELPTVAPAYHLGR